MRSALSVRLWCHLLRPDYLQVRAGLRAVCARAWWSSQPAHPSRPSVKPSVDSLLIQSTYAIVDARVKVMDASMGTK